MKIVFHLNSMGHGGAERVVSILSAYFVKMGHDVTITTQWYSDKEYELAKGVKRVSVGLTPQDEKKGRLGKAWSRLFHLRDFIKKERPDFVISFCCKANFRSAFSLFGMPIPLLVSVRNNPLEDYAPHKLATWYMERKACGCVFQTPDAQAFFSDAFQKKSKIIFNPLSEVYYTEKEQKQSNMISVRKKEIVNVGRITAQKNQMLLIRAFAEIADEYPDYILKIYGDIENQNIYQKLQNVVIQNKLQNRVRFMETTDDIPGAIREASAFVLSSDYEGMPNALIEAMVLGLPCISTDCPCGGSALLIQNNVSGILTPVGDVGALSGALKYILEDPHRAECMGQKARLIKDKVNPERISKEWLDYIEEIVEERQSGIHG